MADAEIRLANRDLVGRKLRALYERMGPDSPAARAALHRAGMLITNQAKLNIRRHGLIDTGRLINSLRWEFFRGDDGRQGIRVGSFGVPYAAIWEFGHNGPVPVRSHNRLVTQAFGKPLATPVISTVRPHSRTVDRRAKPYLRPAYEQHKNKIVRIISEGLAGGL